MKIRVAVTIGDPNGIGPEVALKAVSHRSVTRVCKPLLIGPLQVFQYYATKLRIRLPAGTLIHEPDPVPAFRPKPGKPSASGGRIALAAINAGIQLIRSRHASALVTGPVSKQSLRRGGVPMPGQTEYLQRLTGSRRAAMVLESPHLRIGLVSIHVPVKDVPKMITRRLVREKLDTIRTGMITDWRIPRPRIAVLGLNPHAGEGGLLGSEEKRIIQPVVSDLRAKEQLFFGPFPSDSFFSGYAQGRYDAVIAMYHDQGLIPLKMTAGGKGVNITVGLPVVRTSPDHGTGFDIAGKGRAGAESLIEAIRTAVRIVHNREKTGKQ